MDHLHNIRFRAARTAHPIGDVSRRSAQLAGGHHRFPDIQPYCHCHNIGCGICNAKRTKFSPDAKIRTLNASDRRSDGVALRQRHPIFWTINRYFIFSPRWSPTRNALAMMVSEGFTAPLEGKKLPSTT